MKKSAYNHTKFCPVANSNLAKKLNVDKVRHIRQLACSGVSQSELAKQYNVNPSVITKIVSRRIWRNA